MRATVVPAFWHHALAGVSVRMPFNCKNASVLLMPAPRKGFWRVVWLYGPNERTGIATTGQLMAQITETILSRPGLASQVGLGHHVAHQTKSPNTKSHATKTIASSTFLATSPPLLFERQRKLGRPLRVAPDIFPELFVHLREVPVICPPSPTLEPSTNFHFARTGFSPCRRFSLSSRRFRAC